MEIGGIIMYDIYIYTYMVRQTSILLCGRRTTGV